MDGLYQEQVYVADDYGSHSRALEAPTADPCHGIVGFDHGEEHHYENEGVLLFRLAYLSYHAPDSGKADVFLDCSAHLNSSGVHDSGSLIVSLSRLAHQSSGDVRGPGSAEHRTCVYLSRRAESEDANP